MVRDFHQQPQQQASKSQRFRTQSPRSTPRLCHDFGVQPDPHIAQDQGHTDKQQTQDRVAATGADARLMPLSIGRLNAKPSPIGGANPAQGAMCDAPGGIQQGFSPVTPSLAPRVVTHHGQVEGRLALLSALQSLFEKYQAASRLSIKRVIAT